MDFYAVLDQTLDLLRQRGRVTYRALKLQFTLDDDQLETLKDELLYAHPQVVDDAGRGLLWTAARETAPPPAVAPAPAQDRAPLAYTPPHLAEKILTSRATLEGERKQVTVLFADIKDSTELIKDLDPEAAQQLLDPAIHIMMDAVHRFEGTVNQVLGDGIMALFGAPIAYEDHALRACYAALAMQAAMQPYAEEVRRRHGVTLRVRVGLNTGEAVVRAIGHDLHMDYSAVGQTVHLAARMEQLAPPGSILLTTAALRLVEGLTRFVGREPELAALTQALAQAGAGRGQVVALVGEAGVGKSRLVYECLHSQRTQGWRVLEAVSVSYGKATPYFPVLDLLKRYAQVDDHDDTRTIRAKVTAMC